MPIVFTVHGPYEVPLRDHVKSKMVAESMNEFWNAHESISTEIGCYVFAVRAAKGYTPLYIGKTTRGSFKTECFTSHKRDHYNNALATYDKGTPVMFFVAHPKQKGPTNETAICEIEDYLIRTGVKINPNLRNINGIKQPKWGIQGVIRGGKGNKNNDQKAFCRVFGI